MGNGRTNVFGFDPVFDEVAVGGNEELDVVFGGRDVDVGRHFTPCRKKTYTVDTRKNI